eukprot:gnl/MRDRNA2_/MRDRNA2_92745_c0_seq1.p1 gnl/MRDRNA2_/MRDRNA2_92745_c0~~gnl/MRDRNA2_/MRDRNA2_92745_c0_seq1.p1  ORF type:complete len:900 (+),score=190.80 gnl/MRDRNA2_/MRDRNA2_92745_c0_seq1:76-2775(+)
MFSQPTAVISANIPVWKADAGQHQHQDELDIDDHHMAALQGMERWLKRNAAAHIQKQHESCRNHINEYMDDESDLFGDEPPLESNSEFRTATNSDCFQEPPSQRHNPFKGSFRSSAKDHSSEAFPERDEMPEIQARLDELVARHAKQDEAFKAQPRLPGSDCLGSRLDEMVAVTMQRGAMEAHCIPRDRQHCDTLPGSPHDTVSVQNSYESYELNNYVDRTSDVGDYMQSHYESENQQPAHSPYEVVMRSQKAQREIAARYSNEVQGFDVPHGKQSLLANVNIDDADIQKELEEVRSRKQSLMNELEDASSQGLVAPLSLSSEVTRPEESHRAAAQHAAACQDRQHWESRPADLKMKFENCKDGHHEIPAQLLPSQLPPQGISENDQQFQTVGNDHEFHAEVAHDPHNIEDLQEEINRYLIHHVPQQHLHAEGWDESDHEDEQHQHCDVDHVLQAQESDETESHVQNTSVSSDFEKPQTPREQWIDFVDAQETRPEHADHKGELSDQKMSAMRSAVPRPLSVPRGNRSLPHADKAAGCSAGASAIPPPAPRRVQPSSLLVTPRNAPNYAVDTVSSGLKVPGAKGAAIAKAVAATAAGAAAAASVAGEATKKALGCGSAQRSSSARRASQLPRELKLAPGPAAVVPPPKLRQDDLEGPALNGAFSLHSGVTETRCVAAQNKRREERQKQIAAHLEEREMGQCTFAPKITSMAKAQKKIDTEAQAKRLNQQKINWELRQEELRQEKLRKEFAECSFAPNTEKTKPAARSKSGKPPANTCLAADQMVSKFVERQQKGREARESARKAACLRPDDENLNVASAPSSINTCHSGRRSNCNRNEENFHSSHCTPREECTSHMVASCVPRAACSLAVQEAAHNFASQGQSSNLRAVLQNELRSLAL